MKLKKGDRIQLVEKKAISSKKQFYQAVSQISEVQKDFSLTLVRNKKKFRISYQVTPFKNKKKLRISHIIKVTKTSPVKVAKRKAMQKKRRKLASQSKTPLKTLKPIKKIPENKKPVKAKKQSLVPKKYKAHLQRAYVLADNSFVYEKPNFDSPKLYHLTIGQQILISKKIFRPPHKFGSFYKVFLFEDKKVVGYLSEAEVVPEFIIQNKETKPNPAYIMTKKQLAKDKVLDVGLIDKIKTSHIKSKEKPKLKKQKNSKKRYIGLSTGLFLDSLLFTPTPEDIQKNTSIGLRLSGYDLLISYLNMDLNLAFSPSDFKVFYMDMLTVYPVIKASPYYLYVMGGGKMNINKRNKDPVDFGLAGALSLTIPFQQKWLFRGDLKTGYAIRSKSFGYKISTSLQIAF